MGIARYIGRKLCNPEAARYQCIAKKTIIKLAIIEVHIQVVTRVGFKMLGQAAIEQRSRKQQRNQRRKFFFDAADLVVLDVDYDQLIRVIP